MPPHQSLWGNQKGSPPSPRQQAAQRCEDRSIGWPVTNARVQLPFENSDLVLEHHDLDILLRLGPLARHNEAKDPEETDVKEREEHTG